MEFRYYRIIEQQKHRRVCAYAQTHQSIFCSHTQTMEVDEDADPIRLKDFLRICDKYQNFLCGPMYVFTDVVIC